jgi:hypothetical protein
MITDYDFDSLNEPAGITIIYEFKQHDLQPESLASLGQREFLH